MEVAHIAGRIALYAIPVVLAITLHEVAHGFVAWRLGDSTARDAGRLTLNPLRHVDPVGTVVVPALFIALGGVVFGWAKPVPVRVARLHRPRRDMALVALAGPAANLAMGALWALVLKAVVVYHLGLGALGEPLATMCLAGILINTVLLVLNLLPLPPLDGGRVAVSLLPPAAGQRYARIEPFGLIILVALLFTGTLGDVMRPALRLVGDALLGLAGVRAGLF